MFNQVRNYTLSVSFKSGTLKESDVEKVVGREQYQGCYGLGRTEARFHFGRKQTLEKAKARVKAKFRNKVRVEIEPNYYCRTKKEALQALIDGKLEDFESFQVVGEGQVHDTCGAEVYFVEIARKLEQLRSIINSVPRKPWGCHLSRWIKVVYSVTGDDEHTWTIEEARKW